METVLIVLVCCFCSVVGAGDTLVGAASADRDERALAVVRDPNRGIFEEVL